MIRQPLTREERERLLAARDAALSEYNAAMNRVAECVPGSECESAAVAAGAAYLEAATRMEGEYFSRLPRIVMSCCPLDGKPLVRTFDPFGEEGLWWRSDAMPEVVPSCPHFCVLRGAADAPYVIPRILEKPGMIAVVSQVQMDGGRSLFLSAYFAPRRPPVQDLAANWPRDVFVFTNALGQSWWRFDKEVRDHDLGPWLGHGRIRWCDPDSGNERLSALSNDRCPYVGGRSGRESFSS